MATIGIYKTISLFGSNFIRIIIIMWYVGIGWFKFNRISKNRTKQQYVVPSCYHNMIFHIVELYTWFFFYQTFYTFMELQNYHIKFLIVYWHNDRLSKIKMINTYLFTYVDSKALNNWVSVFSYRPRIQDSMIDCNQDWDTSCHRPVRTVLRTIRLKKSTELFSEKSFLDQKLLRGRICLSSTCFISKTVQLLLTQRTCY